MRRPVLRQHQLTRLGLGLEVRVRVRVIFSNIRRFLTPNRILSIENTSPTLFDTRDVFRIRAASQNPTGPRGEPGQRNGWTLAPGDWPKESALREHRNILIRDHLQRGMTVAYRTSSTSTTSATSNPSWSAVEPGWRYYAHFIKVRMSSASL